MMQWFLNWKIRTKILSIIYLMALFIGIVGFIGYYFDRKASVQMTDIYAIRLMSIKYINDASSQSRAAEAEMFHMMLETDFGARNEQLKQIYIRAKNFDISYSNYLKLPAGSYEKERWPKIQQELTDYTDERNKVMDLAYRGDLRGAYDYFIEHAQSHLNALNVLLEELADFSAKSANIIYSQNAVDHALVAKLIIFIPILIAFLCIILGFMMARIISNPIKKVLVSVDRVAGGDLAIKDIIIKGNDEAGQLATSFNTMKRNLHGLVKQVSQSSEQVAASSEELTAIAEQNTQASAQIAASIELVAQGTEKQVRAVKETSLAVEEISASTKEVAASTVEITNSMVKTLATTQAGQKALDRVVQEIKNISVGSNRVQHSIMELSTSSEKIGQIIEVITGIADQTNLLALNAAIEAARAGEHGRGFAVVAEEVRKLAQQSREATTQITFFIDQNHRNIDAAVTVMEDGVNNVKAGVEVVSVAEQAFSEIAYLVENVSAQMEQISATIQQITSGNQQIVTSVSQVDLISKETSGQAQTVSAGVEEQTASMEQVASSAQSLAAMAAELQSIIHRFVI